MFRYVRRSLYIWTWRLVADGAWQSTSFYSGLTNVGTGLLSALIYLLALQRVQSKKRVQTASYSVDEAREPLRS